MALSIIDSAKKRPQDFLFPNRYFRGRVKGIAPVPAYFYHQVETAEFSRICSTIASGGFRTLTIGDLLDGFSKGGSEVLITFDDGWSSVWSIAFPLARRYDIRFTLFVVPQAVEDSQECRSTLDDDVDLQTIVARDRGPRRMLTWGEARAMHDSGIVDVQSHSLHHGVVFRADQLVGFCTPDGPFPLYGMAPLVIRKEKDIAEFQPPLGTPLCPWGPALAVPRRFIEDPLLRERCARLVRDRGGAKFFAADGWQDALLSECDGNGNGIWEGEKERLERYREDLLAARQSIEEQLPNARVRAVAPPWGVMHADLPAIAHETGHEIIVLSHPFHPISNSPIPLYPRLYGDAIWTLLHGPLYGGIEWLRSRRHAIARKAYGATP